MQTSIHALPPELLSTIFIHCVPLHFDCELDPSFQEYYFPLTLASVCSWWRRVALETLELWTRICIERFMIYRFKDVPALLDMWLDRSKSAPLHVIFKSGFYVNRLEVARFPLCEDSALFECITAKLKPHESRIKTLVNYGNTDLLRTLRISEMSSLDTLLQMADRLMAERGATIGFHMNAPLRSLLVGPYIRISPLSLINQTQLDLLYVTLSLPQDARDILAALPNLESVEFKLDGPDERTKPSKNEHARGRQQLSKLFSLRLIAQDGGDTSVIFDSFNAPQLKELVVGSYTDMRQYPWRSLRNFIVVSGSGGLSKLRDLAIMNLSPSTRSGIGLLDVLRALPGLSYLHLRRGTMDNDMLRSMVLDESSAEHQPVPQLLGLILQNEDEIEDSYFLAMLRSRAHIMEFVGAEYCDKMNPDNEELYLALGIPDITITYTESLDLEPREESDDHGDEDVGVRNDDDNEGEDEDGTL